MNDEKWYYWRCSECNINYAGRSVDRKCKCGGYTKFFCKICKAEFPTNTIVDKHIAKKHKNTEYVPRKRKKNSTAGQDEISQNIQPAPDIWGVDAGLDITTSAPIPETPPLNPAPTTRIIGGVFIPHYESSEFPGKVLIGPNIVIDNAQLAHEIAQRGLTHQSKKGRIGIAGQYPTIILLKNQEEITPATDNVYLLEKGARFFLRLQLRNNLQANCGLLLVKYTGTLGTLRKFDPKLQTVPRCFWKDIEFEYDDNRIWVFCLLSGVATEPLNCVCLTIHPQDKTAPTTTATSVSMVPLHDSFLKDTIKKISNLFK